MIPYKNKAILIIAILLITSAQAFSQKDTLKKEIEIQRIVDDKYIDDEFVMDDSDEGTEIEYAEDDQIFILVEQMPEFPGGTTALRRWIAEQLEWPSQANDIWGTIYIRIEIKKTGEIGKVELQRGIDPLLDNEAIRVIKSLPKFIPGEQNGKKVNVWLSIPVTFKIN